MKLKTYFNDIHYSRKKPSKILDLILEGAEFIYKNIINFKNSRYNRGSLKEKKVDAYVICVGNLTTGGVGKTPIVQYLANNSPNKTAIISRGYGAKLQNKKPNIIKDGEIFFNDGKLCGDEAYQTALYTKEDVVVITCANRLLAAKEAIERGCKTIILDDGFSNRKIKKDKTIIVIDSKMRFGNQRLLPKGPLREPVCEINRADVIYLSDKGDENIQEAITWAKAFKLPLKVCRMRPYRIYNAQTKAQVKIQNQKPKAIAFCAIGQPKQFFDFAKEFYDVVLNFSFEDHHKYCANDIRYMIKAARQKGCSTFLTTQKDETKLRDLIRDIKKFSFNVLELKLEVEEIPLS